MLYFPIFWSLSILAYVLFFILLNLNKKEYKLTVENYPGSQFPKIKTLKSIMRTTNDLKIKNNPKLMLLSLYLSRILVVVPIIIYFVNGIFFTK